MGDFEFDEMVASLKLSGCCMTYNGDRLDLDLMRKLVNAVEPKVVVQEGWKVRHIKSGLFCKGGGMPSTKLRLGMSVNDVVYDNKHAPPSECFHKTGKLWNARHHIESHIRHNMEWYDKFAEELEVIRVQSVVAEVIPMREHYNEVKRIALKRQAERDSDQAKRRIEFLKEKQEKLDLEKQANADELARLNATV